MRRHKTSSRLFRRPSASRAFTLLEILVVIAIIGLLVGLAVTRTGNIFGGAQVTTAQLFVHTSIKTPLETYRMSMGNYPTTADGLQALVTAPAARADRWMGPYLEGTPPKVPIDPWGNTYQYAYPGTHNKDRYDIWSMGPDGQTGTADDVGNWDKATPENK